MYRWIDDAAFDEQLPVRLRIQSLTHFTTIAVARRAAPLLAPSSGTLVLDVGSGAGKFCLTAALAAPHSQFVGVEWRPHLVAVANGLAAELGITNARFILGDALELDWSAFDSFYLFNPFAEQLEPTWALDRTITFDADRFIDSVRAVRHKLASARVGTRVVTYHGYGAPLPISYAHTARELVGCDHLELWIKKGSVAGELGMHGELV